MLIAGLLACGAEAKTQDYVLDGAHTHIVWKVDRFGFTNTVGSFVDIQGSLKLDEDNPEASRVTATIAVSGLRSDLTEREDIIRGPHWLGGDAFPEITFRSTKVELLSEDGEKERARVTGDLMLKGITAPVTMVVSLNKIGVEPSSRKKAMGFSATGRFERIDFGINTALKFIGNEVAFDIEALAVSTQAP